MNSVMVRLNFAWKWMNLIAARCRPDKFAHAFSQLRMIYQTNARYIHFELDWILRRVKSHLFWPMITDIYPHIWHLIYTEIIISRVFHQIRTQMYFCVWIFHYIISVMWISKCIFRRYPWQRSHSRRKTTNAYPIAQSEAIWEQKNKKNERTKNCIIRIRRATYTHTHSSIHTARERRSVVAINMVWDLIYCRCRWWNS